MSKKDGSDDKAKLPVEGPIPLTLMKALQAGNRKEGSDSGSTNGGNQSEDSALVSFGNTSFFNFDGEEGMASSSPVRSGGNSEINSEDDGAGGVTGDGGNEGPRLDKKLDVETAAKLSSSRPEANLANKSSTSSLTSADGSIQQDRRVAASAQQPGIDAPVTDSRNPSVEEDKPDHSVSTGSTGRKRKGSIRSEQDSVDYNTDRGSDEDDDDDDDDNSMDETHVKNSRTAYDDDETSGSKSTTKGSKKKRKPSDRKRVERNAREKERSLRIAKKINELRDILSSGGVIVPKGTKSSVLSEAANYIKLLQQHQYRSEIDRQQLVQQMQLIGNGAHGPQAASAIRHVAAQNGVWSLGNFGGMPPKSAMTFYSGTTESAPSQPTDASEVLQVSKLDSSDYRFVFNSCGIAMAIASMGGAFLDCNHLFSKLSGYSKLELCSLTIFNLTARQDLQIAFDQMSQLISPPTTAGGKHALKPITLRGLLKNRTDLGLSVSLVKGEDGIAKCFCVVLTNVPQAPFDNKLPSPVSFESLSPLLHPTNGAKIESQLNVTPTYTTG